MSNIRTDLATRLSRWARFLENSPHVDPLPTKEQKHVSRLVADEQFRRRRKKCNLRELPLTAIFPGVERCSIPLGAINSETGHANHAEMLYVVGAAAYRNARRIFEFGTFMGRTTYHLAATTVDAHVWTLDLPRDANPWPFAGHVGSYFFDTPEAARITSLREDSTSFDPAPFRGSMDFVWVDADHSYSGVKNDTAKALQLLAPGGTIMWHDFSADSPGLVEFFAEFTQGQPLFHLAKTSVLMHIDGIDPLGFVPHPVPFSRSVFKNPSADVLETEAT